MQLTVNPEGTCFKLVLRTIDYPEDGTDLMSNQPTPTHTLFMHRYAVLGLWQAQRTFYISLMLF